MLFAKQIEAVYRQQLFARQDGTKPIFYFSAADFPGLHKTPYPFPSPDGHTLQGYFYCYDNPIPGRIVIFEHGMGDGHQAYMTEIETLARHGYLVFAYDHTGCMASGGSSTNGFAQSLNDLDACVTALKSDAAYQDLALSVVGHSWGGFSSMNIGALHPEIRHIVAMSGFISVEQILKQSFSGVLRFFRKHLYRLEASANPNYIHRNAVDSLKSTSAEVLLIYSSDDQLVKQAFHYDILLKNLSDRKNIHFLLVDKKGHNPNYTEDAVAYKDAFFATMNKKLKRKELADPESAQTFIRSYDWRRMTAQDQQIWAEIFALLDQ